MTPEVYLTDSERTMAKFPEGMGMDYQTACKLIDLIQEAVLSCRVADDMKKHLYYGKPLPEKQQSMTVSNSHFENIQKLDEREVNLLHAALGKLTEAGEVLENVFAYISSPDQNYDVVNTVEEVGDGWWYDAILLRDANMSMGGCMQRNIDKLRVRYPEKFDSTLATNRDLEKEREVLAGTNQPPKAE